MKKNKMMLLAAACSILLLGSCGTSKNLQGSGSTSASHQKENATKGSDSRQSETLRKLAFVQKVSDNQVYTRNIVGNMSFTLQAGDNDITVPGKLVVRHSARRPHAGAIDAEGYYMFQTQEDK